MYSLGLAAQLAQGRCLELREVAARSRLATGARPSRGARRGLVRADRHLAPSGAAGVRTSH